MAEAAADSFSGCRETEVTSRLMSSSTLIFFNTPGDGKAWLVWAEAWLAVANKPSDRRTKVNDRLINLRCNNAVGRMGIGNLPPGVRWHRSVISSLIFQLGLMTDSKERGSFT